MSRPTVLYRYEALTVQTLKNLKRGVMYFGSPLNFNDPYDCAIQPTILTPDSRQLEAIREFHLNSPDTSESAYRDLREITNDQLSEILQLELATTIKDKVEEFLSTSGVVCFSESNEDLLMWSHYGGRYKGICLEFDVSFIPEEKLKPVNYVESLPELDAVKTYLEGAPEIVTTLFRTKSMAWKYEREWRAIHEKAGTEYVYPVSALKGVFFGPDTEHAMKEIVCLIVLGHNDQVKFWNGTRSKREFKVDFYEVNYTPYLEAKQQGLIE